ncbi:glycosyltransferase family A protein [Yeosuana sp. MJ-SS3]|uniref:Glycosyltransferase family A protein n=1 Tax=Gilvirhabdus luticola TaxID=3079858 RepID=A0ABU3U4X0_9FLAO|nr:glycosyltransferase family A protein [Yeosuana sp. MJ-SS3]MDU8885459.1 glycosyltransferase family A protein [Yeosuana sp. MJ-SS3]
MLFNFLTYLQPTHYFSLFRNNNDSIFPIIADLPEHIIEQLESDTHFNSNVATQYDLSWQALQKGYIGSAKTYSSIEGLPIEDNYLFLRKYFHFLWVFYVLVFRILSFKNPVKEFKSWYKTRNTKRSNYVNTPIEHEDWSHFESGLLNEKPKVSVVIPTLNRYLYLKDVFQDLEQQDYKHFEVIVVDQSDDFQVQFYNSFALDIQVTHQQEKALWLARNTAIRKSKADYLLFFDDDSRIDSDWIRNHLKCLDFFNADISSGVSISKVGAKVPDHYSFFRISDQLDTGNVLIKKDVFKTIGLFDRQFEKQRMGDGEFGLRAYLHGYLNVSNPFAKRLHLKVDSGGLRDMGIWDAFRTNKWFAPRPIPSVLYLFRRYYGNASAKRALWRTIPLSIMPYKFKTHKGMILLGIFISFLLTPIVFLQVVKSWRLSSIKLKQGPLIESL